MLKIKGKRAIKVFSEDGDFTPTGTEMYVIGKCIIPQAVNDMAIADGIKPIEAMYSIVKKDSDNINVISSEKVEILEEELTEVEINLTEEEFNKAKRELQSLRFEFFE